MVRVYYPNEIGDAKHFYEFVNRKLRKPANKFPATMIDFRFEVVYRKVN
jgi:hypothetical protein